MSYIFFTPEKNTQLSLQNFKLIILHYALDTLQVAHHILHKAHFMTDYDIQLIYEHPCSSNVLQKLMKTVHLMTNVMILAFCDRMKEK